MKRTYFIVLSFFVIVIAQTSSLRLQSHAAQPATGGLAGDPNQRTCLHCHSDFAPADTSHSRFVIRMARDSASLSSSSSILSSTSQYTPGATHWMSVQVNGHNGNSPKYGFQIVPLNATDSMAGSFIVTSANNTATENLQGTSNVYMSHHHADANNIWYFKWTAPMSGAVTFYYNGNSANGDNNSTGDSICQGKVTITAGGAGLNELTNNISAVSAFPMPLANMLNTKVELKTTSPLSISVMNTEGQLIKELFSASSAPGHFEKSFDIEDLASGVYLLNVSSGSSVRTIKVVKE